MDRDRRVSRFFVEAFVIVSSILLAFGIDAGWDARNMRVEEAEVLAGLSREFADNRETLERRVEQHTEMLSAMSALLRSIEEGAWTETEWSLDEAMGRLVMPPTTDLGSGVRDAIVQAGRLGLLSDPVLRNRLAQWPAYHEEVLDDEASSRALVLDLIVPFLAQAELELAAVLVSGTMAVEPTAQPWPVETSSIVDDGAAVRRLLADPEFKSLVQIRYAYWYHAGGEYRAALAAAEEILALLDEAE